MKNFLFLLLPVSLIFFSLKLEAQEGDKVSRDSVEAFAESFLASLKKGNLAKVKKKLYRADQRTLNYFNEQSQDLENVDLSTAITTRYVKQRAEAAKNIRYVLSYEAEINDSNYYRLNTTVQNLDGDLKISYFRSYVAPQALEDENRLNFENHPNERILSSVLGIVYTLLIGFCSLWFVLKRVRFKYLKALLVWITPAAIRFNWTGAEWSIDWISFTFPPVMLYQSGEFAPWFLQFGIPAGLLISIVWQLLEKKKDS